MQEMVKGKNIRTAFGLAIRYRRLSKGLSQEKLAELANLDRSYISELERGLKSASIITLFKISEALDIHPTELITQTIDLENADES